MLSYFTWRWEIADVMGAFVQIIQTVARGLALRRGGMLHVGRGAPQRPRYAAASATDVVAATDSM
jgi:hypothetical protein